MDINDFQLNHTHGHLISQLCIGWIDENAPLATSRYKFVLLYAMIRLGNIDLAIEDDGPVAPLQLRVGA